MDQNESDSRKPLILITGNKEMPTFRRKPIVNQEIHATQWFSEMANVAGVKIDDDGNPYVTTIQGRKVEVSDGEWIVRESDGIHYYPIADAEFKKLYEEIPQD